MFRSSEAMLFLTTGMKTNFYLKTAIIGGLFAVPFIPLIISPSLFFPFIAGKGFAFRILVEIIFALWLILALRDSDYRPRMSHILTLTSLFLGIILLADVLGVAPYKSFWSNFERMEGFVALFHHFLYFIVAGSILATERLWSLFFHSSIGVSLFIGLYSTLQLLGELVINQGGVRVDGTFGNAAYLASYLLVHIFIICFFLSRDRISRSGDVLLSVALGSVSFLIYYAIHMARLGTEVVQNAGAFVLVVALALLVTSISIYATSRRAIWYIRFGEPVTYSLLALFLGVILIYTATRGAILALIGGALLTAILVVLFERENKTARKIGIGALAGVVIVVGAFFLFKDSDLIRNHPALTRIASISLSEGAPRFTIWNIGWQGFLERPILGFGQENFNYSFNTHYHPRMYAQEQWFDRAHNIFFDWLTAGGALGILSYLSLYGAAIWLIWKRDLKKGWLSRLMSKIHYVPDNSFSVTERSLLTGLIAAYLFQNIFVFDNIVSYILFFTILAYIHATHGQPLSDAWQKRLSFDIGFVNRVLAPLIVVILIAGLYVVNIRPIEAGSTLIQALRKQQEGNLEETYALYQKVFALKTFADSEAREQLIQTAINVVNSQNVDVTTKQKFLTLAKTELEKQLARTPDDARYVLFMGYLLNRTNQSLESIPYLERAVELSPKKQNMYFELGSAYLSAGMTTEAYETFKKAYEFETKYKEAAVFFAVGSLYADKKEEAVNALNQSYGTTTVSDDRLIKAFFEKQQWGLLMPILLERVASNPTSDQFRINLAAAYLQMKQPQKAIQELTILRGFPSVDEQGKAMIDQWISDIKAGKNPQ